MSQFIRGFRANIRQGHAQPVNASVAAEKTEKPKFEDTIAGKVTGFVILGLIGWWMLSPSAPKLAQPSIPLPSNVSALDKMSAVFKGGYSRDQIDDLLSRVMQMHGSPLTEAEYERWGDVLVGLRKTSHPVSEMEILRCMRAMGRPISTLKFYEAAGMCAAGKQLGL